MARRLLGGLILFLGVQTGAWAAPTSAVIATPPQPAWEELQTEQRTVLSPLANEWDKLENFRRKKWLGIAERYPCLLYTSRCV